MNRSDSKLKARMTGALVSAFQPVQKYQVSNVSLGHYVERIKGITLDAWQWNICNRLEINFWASRYGLLEFEPIDLGTGSIRLHTGVECSKEEWLQKQGKGEYVAIHAPPQYGKSIIISQCQPAWILGNDPTHRVRLLTYNILHSARFSRVVQTIMRSQAHKAIFQDRQSHIPERSKTVEWSTFARLDYNDGQASFAGLGLQSGLTGSGYDTLIIDDPYKSAEEAYSEVIREKTWITWTDTARVRANDRSNVQLMFHRYHQDDLGGRAIASCEFNLWRYAAQCDGDYVDPVSGLRFTDPIGRVEGEYLSPRFSSAYYDKQKANKKAWNSQFQGKPVDDEGNMFDVRKFNYVTKRSELPKFIHLVRAWDNAATAEGGAYTVGVLMGITYDGKLYILDVIRQQVNTAEREKLQKETAEKDGKLVEVHAPQDPGSAGKDIAFQFCQMLRDYVVTTTVVSGKKEHRADPFSKEVNKGNVWLFDNGDWDTKTFKDELQNFPLSTYKDQVDASSDACNHLLRLFYRGLVIKNFEEVKQVVGWTAFTEQFGALHPTLGLRMPKIPSHWEVSAALRVEADISKPSGWAILARAAENAYIGDAVFLVASARGYINPYECVTQLRNAFLRYCESGLDAAKIIWVSKESADVLAVAQNKLGIILSEFEGDALNGITETNWYMEKEEMQHHPFFAVNRENPVPRPRFYVLSEDGEQMHSPSNEAGQISARQEFATWTYNEQKKPQEYGGVVLDCVRMLLYNFAVKAKALTKEEEIELKIAANHPHLTEKELYSRAGQDGFGLDLRAREILKSKYAKEANTENEKLEQAFTRALGAPKRRR